MNNCRFKYDELLQKRDIIILNYNNGIAGKILLSIFKDFCVCCYSLKEWCGLSLADFGHSIYIDICRGVANGDKHVLITKDISSYKSGYYRTNVNNGSPTTQSSTDGYIGDGSNPLYIDPGNKKLIVETENGNFGILDIVDGSIKDWEHILKLKGLI